MNRAKTRAAREHKAVPFTSLAEAGAEPAVPPERFLRDGDVWAGHWATAPRPPQPEERLLVAEIRERLASAIRALPPEQRAVLVLRDVESVCREAVEAVTDYLDGALPPASGCGSSST